jgi:hypothetical protein
VASRLAPQSDGDVMVLQARAMLAGNWLLHGWRLSDVSFWTTELPQYALAVAVLGARPEVVRVCAAVTWAMCAALAAVAASDGFRGRARVAAVVVAAVVMAGPSAAASAVILNDADHTGTAVPVLAAFLLAARAGRHPLAAPAVAWVLAAAVAGDPLALVTGVAPLALVAMARAGVTARRAEGGAAARIASARRELALVAAAGCGGAAGMLVPWAVRAAGGWTDFPASLSLALSPAARAHAAVLAAGNLRGLFSAWPSGQWGHGLTADALAVAHLGGALAVIAGVAAGLRLAARPSADLVAPLLAVAIAANAGVYALAYNVTAGNGREVAPVLVLGAALAGRVAGPWLALGRHRVRLLAVQAVAAGLSCLPVLVAHSPPPACAGLAGWLAARHLDHGIGGYWQAAACTAASGGAVTVIAADQPAGGRIRAREWESDLPPASGRAAYTFVICAPNGLTVPAAIGQFGRPARQWHRSGGITVLSWRRNLLPRLAPPGP